jgi:uncharacterized membrane protein
VTVTPLAGFTADVSLALTGLPASQASWGFAPTTVTAGSGTSQLTVTPAATLAPGSYALTIAGTGGGLARTAQLTLVVTSPAEFALSVDPASQTVKRAKSASYTVDVSSLAGYAGTVTLSVSGLPAQATATFSPGSVVAPGSSTLTVKTKGKTPRGTFTLIVTGTSGATVRQAAVTLIVA